MASYMLAIFTFTVLVAVPHTQSKPATFRKLSENEVSANSTWAFKSSVLEYESVRLKNCGPPASFSITPWPPASNQKIKIELNFTAAHILLGGELSIYANMWPYELHYDACDYIRQQTGFTMCPLKKGETYMYRDGVLIRDNNLHILPNQGHLIGNATITNDFGDVILCVSADVKLPIDFKRKGNK